LACSGMIEGIVPRQSPARWAEPLAVETSAGGPPRVLCRRARFVPPPLAT
jgi:hypothetical protein